MQPVAVPRASPRAAAAQAEGRPAAWPSLASGGAYRSPTAARAGFGPGTGPMAVSGPTGQATAEGPGLGQAMGPMPIAPSKTTATAGPTQVLASQAGEEPQPLLSGARSPPLVGAVPVAGTTAAAGAAEVVAPPWSTLVVSDRMTGRHWAYLAIQTIGAVIIGGFINFGIHVPVYKGTTKGVRFWYFPGNLAGDLVITLIATVVISWLISSLLCPADVKAGRVTPLAPTAMRWWPARGTWLHRMMSSHDLLWPPPLAPGQSRARQRLRLLGRNIWRGLVLCVPSFLLWWVLAVIICNAIWGNIGYNDWPQPQIILGVYGGLVSASTTLVVAVCCLVSVGDRLLLAREGAALAGVPAGAAVAGGVQVAALEAGTVGAATATGKGPVGGPIATAPLVPGTAQPAGLGPSAAGVATTAVEGRRTVPVTTSGAVKTPLGALATGAGQYPATGAGVASGMATGTPSTEGGLGARSSPRSTTAAGAAPGSGQPTTPGSVPLDRHASWVPIEPETGRTRKLH